MNNPGGKPKNFFSKFFNKDLLYVKTENGKTSVFALTFPIFFELIAAQLIGMIQAAMASRYMDGFFVIPINNVNVVMGFFNALIITASMGVTILLSAYLGKKDGDSAKRIIGNGIILAVAISVMFCLPGIFLSENILSLMGMQGSEYAKYVPYAAQLLRYRLIIVVLFQWYGVLTMALRCYGYSSVGFYCSLLSGTVAAVSTFIALFIVKIESSAFTVVISVISAFATLLAMLLAVFFSVKKKMKISLRPEWKWIKSLLKVGVPSSVFQLSYNLSQIITTAICYSLTEEVLLAKLYASQILVFVYTFGYALGKANGIMVGRECGEGDFERAKKITSQNQKIVLITNFTLSLLAAALSVPLLKLLFNASENVVTYALPIFFLDIVVELGRAFGHIGEGGLNATGDVVFMSSVALVSCWAFSVGLTYVFVKVIPLGVIGVWIAFAVDEICRGLCYYLRWKSGKWEKSFNKKVAS
ncbi:MAG: MATE family efflux transporter [Clostridia bacterium]|nr:MATE family efflux transporter [Clostridia bacterium]